MAKRHILVKETNRTFRVKVATKFRIGPRKSGQCASQMSNSDLLAVLETADKSKYHSNAKTVLGYRGVFV